MQNILVVVGKLNKKPVYSETAEIRKKEAEVCLVCSQSSELYTIGRSTKTCLTNEALKMWKE